MDARGPAIDSPEATAADELSTDNGLSVNGLSSNGLSGNGLSSNGLSGNGLSGNGLSNNGLSSNGLSSNGLSSNGFSAWFDSGSNNATSHAYASQLMKYLVRCACPAGTTRTFTDPATNTSYSWAGSLGLAPAWCQGNPATVADQEWVSACLLAHVNRFADPLNPDPNVSVQISIRAPCDNGEVSTPIGAEEYAALNRDEGIYFGNIFDQSNPSTPRGAHSARYDDDVGGSSHYKLRIPLGRSCHLDGCGSQVWEGRVFDSSEMYDLSMIDLQHTNPDKVCSTSAECTTAADGLLSRCGNLVNRSNNSGRCVPPQLNCELDANRMARRCIDMAGTTWSRVLTVKTPTLIDAVFSLGSPNSTAQVGPPGSASIAPIAMTGTGTWLMLGITFNSQVAPTNGYKIRVRYYKGSTGTLALGVMPGSTSKMNSISPARYTWYPAKTASCASGWCWLEWTNVSLPGPINAFALKSTGTITGIDLLSVGAIDTGVQRVTFCSGAAPSLTAPSNLSASPVSGNSVTLSWASVTGAANYEVYRDFDGSPVATVSSSPYAFSGLPCGTYRLTVRAKNGNRLSVKAPAVPVNISSSCADKTAPSVPVLQTSKSASTITVSWPASTDNVGVTGYRAHSNTNQGDSQTVATTQTSVTFPWIPTCELAGGWELAKAYFYVEALDAAGNIATSNTIIVPRCNDTTPPSAPTGLSRSNATQTGATLSWTPSTDNVGVTSYYVGFSALTAEWGWYEASVSAPPLAITGLTCGTTYAVMIYALDQAGNSSEPSAPFGLATAACSSGSPDAQAPLAPTNLSVSNPSSTRLVLNWAASADDYWVAGYEMFLNGTWVASAYCDMSPCSYSYGGYSTEMWMLAPAKSYTLGVRAVDNAGHASATASIIGTTSGVADTTAPSVPSGLAAHSIGPTSLVLSFKSTDNVAVSGYKAYKNGALAGTVSAPEFSPSYYYKSLTCNTTYSLTVSAYDTSGKTSAQSAPLSVKTAACP